MSQAAANHHRNAAKKHREAAEHHDKAAQALEEGQLNKAAVHAQNAHDSGDTAMNFAEKALQDEDD